MKILTVVGARPQFVKAAVVSAALARQGNMVETMVHTGQHFDDNMSDVFFAELGLPAPRHHLGVHGGGHGEMTGRMMIELERVMQAERPDAVLVYGDTNSTLAGALVAAKLRVPMGHVEAGLRSFNMDMPEEVNRIVADRLSRWLYAPTETAVANLRQEGVAPSRILQVGDVMYDVALLFGARVGSATPLLSSLGLEAGNYVLATIHRAENTDDPSRLRAIVDGLARTSREIAVVWPMHPRTHQTLCDAGLVLEHHAGLRVIEPGYLGMVELEKNAAIIATDSGGVQKEAFFHRVPCITLRTETEWVELVDAGWNRVVPPTDADAIVRALQDARGTRGRDVAPYGSGDAAERIVRHLAANAG